MIRDFLLDVPDSLTLQFTQKKCIQLCFLFHDRLLIVSN